MPSVSQAKQLLSGPFSILLSFRHLSLLSWFSKWEVLRGGINHMLIDSQQHCISNSMLVNQNEPKGSSSGLRMLKISCSICWVLRIKTTGGQLVAVLNKIWRFCPIGCHYEKPELSVRLTALCSWLVGSDQARKCRFPGTQPAKKGNRWLSSDPLVAHHNGTVVEFTLHLWFN